MKNGYYTPAFIAALFFSLTLFAQSAPQWRQLSGSDGVTSFAFSDDYVWVASRSGLNQLNRHTGERVANFNSANSDLLTHAIATISVDRGQGVWLGYTYYGFQYFKNNQWQQFDTLPDGQNIKYGGIVQALDTAEALFVATGVDDSTRLVHVKGNVLTIEPLPAGYGFANSATAVDTAGGIWFALRKGSGADLKWYLGRFSDAGWSVFDPDSLAQNYFYAYDLAADKLGNVYALGNQEVIRYDGANWTKFLRPITNAGTNQATSPLYVDGQNQLWLAGMHNQGDSVFRYVGNDTWIGIDLSMWGLPAGYVSTFQPDDVGNWWFIHQRDPGDNSWTESEFYQFKNQQLNQVDLSIGGMPGGRLTGFDLRAGAAGYAGLHQKLAVYHGDTWSTILLPGPGYNYPGLQSDNAGNIWIAGYDSLLRYDGSTFTAVSFVIGSPLSFGITANEGLWAVSNGNLYSIADGQATEIELLIPWGGSGGLMYPDPIRKLYVDKEDGLWAIGEKLHYTQDGTTWLLFDNGPTFGPSAYNAAVLKDAEDNIWVYVGLLHFSADGYNWNTIQLPPETGGSSVLYNYSIAEDAEHNIWLSHGNGLLKLNNGQFTQYDVYNSSLPANEILDIKIDNAGNLWIVTDYGITLFNENGIMLSNEDMPAPAEALKIFPNPSAGLLQIDIPKVGNLSMWNSQGQLVFSKTNLPPGLATFQQSILPAGFYLIQLQTPHGILTAKWLKQ